jgi:hypothetical protein
VPSDLSTRHAGVVGVPTADAGVTRSRRLDVLFVAKEWLARRVRQNRNESGFATMMGPRGTGARMATEVSQRTSRAPVKADDPFAALARDDGYTSCPTRRASCKQRARPSASPLPFADHSLARWCFVAVGEPSRSLPLRAARHRDEKSGGRSGESRGSRSACSDPPLLLLGLAVAGAFALILITERAYSLR